MNKISRDLALFLIVAGVLFATLPSEESLAGEEVPTFFDMDKDGDDLISAEEGSYWSALARQWQHVDTNQDGSVDMQEWNEIDVKALLLDSHQ